MDTLHLGGYWPVQEGAERRRRPPPKLGMEQERGFWEERLPRELSMGDPGSRQLTPQPSPPALQLDRRHGLRVPAAARLQELGQQRDQCAAAGHDQAAPLQPHMLPPLLPRLGWRGRAGPDGGDPAPKARYQVKGDDESNRTRTDVVVNLQRGILAPRVTRHYYRPDIAKAGSSVSTRRSPRQERLHRQGRSDIAKALWCCH